MRLAVAILPLVTACSLYFGSGGDGHTGGSGGGGAMVDGTKRVFVTSATYQGGALGGLAGADAKCSDRAAAAGLDGTFAAWLSDAGTSAAERLTHSTGSYVLVDGTTIAASWTDLLRGALAHAIDRDEGGQVRVAVPTCMLVNGAWTATTFDGAYYVAPSGEQYSCGGWTDLHGNGVLGDVSHSDATWTYSGCADLCTNVAALYCIEQ